MRWKVWLSVIGDVVNLRIGSANVGIMRDRAEKKVLEVAA